MTNIRLSESARIRELNYIYGDIWEYKHKLYRRGAMAHLWRDLNIAVGKHVMSSGLLSNAPSSKELPTWFWDYIEHDTTTRVLHKYQTIPVPHTPKEGWLTTYGKKYWTKCYLDGLFDLTAHARKIWAEAIAGNILIYSIGYGLAVPDDEHVKDMLLVYGYTQGDMLIAWHEPVTSERRKEIKESAETLSVGNVKMIRNTPMLTRGLWFTATEIQKKEEMSWCSLNTTTEPQFG